MSEQQYRLGVDVGGSKILAAVFGKDGSLIAKAKKRTKPELGYDGVLERVVKTAQKAAEKAELDWEGGVRGYGVGVPGPIEEPSGRILTAANLGWDAKPIRDDLTRLGGKPVAMGNDVNFGALGEVGLGAARGAASAFFLFVGTGLGGCLVQGDTILGGAHGWGGEIGHLPVPGGSATCGCGQTGCLETVASKTGMRGYFEKQIADGKNCLLRNPTDLRAGDIHQAFVAGCKTTTAALDRVAKGLAWAVVAVAAVADPEVYIFGGGVMEDLGDDVLPMIREHLKEFGFFDKGKRFDLRLAALDGLAVAAGAALAGERLP